MYKFSEVTQRELYLRHGLQTEIISANHFRQDMFRLQRQFLHPHSCQQKLIVVRNFKTKEDMFVVTPLVPLGKFEAREFVKLIESEVEYGRSLDTLR